jgi:hypothetical protein
MIPGRWFITPHAVRRYIMRVRPGLTYEQGLGELIQLSERAHYVKNLDNKAQLWRAGKPIRLRFVVIPSTRGLSALVTVLTEHDVIIQRGSNAPSLCGRRLDGNFIG